MATYIERALDLEPSRVDALGLGPDLPVADNATAAGRAQNRRVELSISGRRPASAAENPTVVRCSHELAVARARNVYALIRQRLADCRVCDIEVVIDGRPLGDDELVPMENNPVIEPGP